MVVSIAMFLPYRVMPYFIVTPERLARYEEINSGWRLVAKKIVIRVT